MGKNLEFAIGILNGAIGDYLARSGNGLATAMSFVLDNEELTPLDRDTFRRAYPAATGRVVVLLHGLMCTESIFDMPGGDYGARLASDHGYTPLYVRYNTGLSIPDNGTSFARLLDRLIDVYPRPIDEILLLGYSMGGLVIRSACHAASEGESKWLPLVERILYVGTPHRGAPLERAGRVLTKILDAIPDPYTRLIAEIGNLRSDGVKDLGDSEIRHEDRARRRRTFSLTDAAHPVPLLPTIRHYLVAGALLADPALAFFGDAIVPLASATGADPNDPAPALAANHVITLPGIDHVSIARSPAVYDAILELLGRDR